MEYMLRGVGYKEKMDMGSLNHQVDELMFCWYLLCSQGNLPVSISTSTHIELQMSEEK